MIQAILLLCLPILAVAILLGFFRMVSGPSVVDRILAFDAVVVCAAGMTVLLSRLWQTPVFLELILIISSLGFFATVAFVFYLQHTSDIGGDSAGDSKSEQTRLGKEPT